MMKKEELDNEFFKYVDNFNMNNKLIYLKYLHSLRVAVIAKNIAISLKLSKEEIDVAYILGLLHDIGRFKQIDSYNTFSDIKSGVDHAKLGVEILFDENIIRNFIKDYKYDNIIKIAIYNHNKFKIQENLNEKELLFCKIIRDADKVDIFKIIINDKTLNEINECNSIDNNNLIISSKVKDEFYNYHSINSKDIVTTLDKYISTICFIFDINFNISFKLIKENDYINKFIDKIYSSYNLDNFIKNEFEKIRNISNKYIIDNI